MWIFKALELNEINWEEWEGRREKGDQERALWDFLLQIRPGYVAYKMPSGYKMQ